MTKEQANKEEVKTVKTEEVKATDEKDEKVKVDDKEESAETETKKTDETVTDDGKDEEVKPQADQETQQQQPTAEQQENMIYIEDLALKVDVDARFTALEAKISAVLDENTQLKDKIAELTDKNEQMVKKYETDDFGDMQKQGLQQTSKVANETFEEYWKRTH